MINFQVSVDSELYKRLLMAAGFLSKSLDEVIGDAISVFLGEIEKDHSVSLDPSRLKISKEITSEIPEPKESSPKGTSKKASGESIPLCEYLGRVTSPPQYGGYSEQRGGDESEQEDLEGLWERSPDVSTVFFGPQFDTNELTNSFVQRSPFSEGKAEVGGSYFSSKSIKSFRPKKEKASPVPEMFSPFRGDRTNDETLAQLSPSLGKEPIPERNLSIPVSISLSKFLERRESIGEKQGIVTTHHKRVLILDPGQRYDVGHLFSVAFPYEYFMWNPSGEGSTGSLEFYRKSMVGEDLLLKAHESGEILCHGGVQIFIGSPEELFNQKQENPTPNFLDVLRKYGGSSKAAREIFSKLSEEGINPSIVVGSVSNYNQKRFVSEVQADICRLEEKKRTQEGENS